MFSSIKDDLRTQWSRPNSGMQRLIIINVVIFLFVNLARFFVPEESYGEFMKFFAMPTAANEFITRPWTFITSFFTHQGFGHILWNMLYMYWFGIILRDFLGAGKLVNIYILGGLSGSLSILLLFNLIPGFGEYAGGFALGASAGVYAIVVAAATLAPDYSMHLLFFGPVKIKYLAAIAIVLAFFGLQGGNFGGELAHLAGAVIGYVYIKSLQGGTDMGAWINSTLAFFKSFFVRQPKMTVNYGKSQSKSSTTSRKTTYTTTRKAGPTQSEIDAILDKISQSGYESLTKEEKEKLFNASRK